jgi:hypothetical protein
MAPDKQATRDWGSLGHALCNPLAHHHEAALLLLQAVVQLLRGLISQGII